MLEKTTNLTRTAYLSPPYDYDELVQRDRVHQLIYTDPAIFTAEMTHVFGAVWVYLAHESQIPNNDDYVTGKLGLRPIIVLRDTKGQIRALYNRCTHRGTTLCRLEKGNSNVFRCPYHGWTFNNDGSIRNVPWPDGYANDVTETRFNAAQIPRVESYRGFIFGTLNMDMPPLTEYLGDVKKPLDEWLDRHPGGKVAICEANRLKYNGNWKLAYDNSCDGYHVVFSHRSLLDMENRLVEEGAKGMSYYKGRPDEQPMYMKYFGHGHHFKDKRPNMEIKPGAMWAVESPHPGMEHYEAELRRRLGDRAPAALDLASSEPVNINIFPNLSILGNHFQVFEPLSVTETNAVWYGTAVVDEEGVWGDELHLINALRMRTQEGFPNFGEVDDLANFEEIQRGLGAFEDEWVYMHRGMDIPGRTVDLGDGVLKAPATDEMFMREYIQYWKRLMQTEPNVQIKREP